MNSRICHICARSENGPRWKADQTSDENRADANLVLMCTRHAGVIDDPANVKSYPEYKLLGLKNEQIEEHKKAINGWQLTDKMAEETLSKSFPDFKLTLTNSEVKLGGEGGRAPGSGGGGGGAFGPGARAGKGGKGGDIINLGDQFPDATEILSDDLKEAGRPAPGSGGSGADAVGPGAVGGDGGDGGDFLSAEIRTEKGDIFEIEVGEGGRGAKFSGQHGQSGGDTVLVHKSEDGHIKRVYRAAGGKGARSGDLPSDWQPITEEDLRNGFQISTLLAANAIEFRDGLIFILGGGWSKYFVPVLPVDVAWPCVCKATWRSLETGVTRGLQLCLTDPSGREVSRIALELPDIGETRKDITWVRTFSAPIEQVGPWHISVTSGDLCLSEIECFVELQEN